MSHDRKTGACVGRASCAAGLLALLFSSGAWAVPDPGWIVQNTRSDCSGSAQQGTPACNDYASDFYENIDYSAGASAGTSDIQAFRIGNDDDYFYVEFDFVAAWNESVSTGHHAVIEIDVDDATEPSRGDYYVSVFQKTEFNSTSWVDAYSQGGYELVEDDNDDVGGANPTTSDFGGSQGDGYDSPLSDSADNVWARIVGGNFQIAVRRSAIGNPSKALFRGSSRQSTSLSKDKLYFHDQNDTSDVSQIDNVAGLSTTDEWVSSFNLVVVKRAFEFDGTPISDSTTMPRGTVFKFLLYIDNSGGAVSDAGVRDVLDSAFAYQSPDALKIDNSQVSSTVCPAGVCDESAIFSAVDTSPDTCGAPGPVCTDATGDDIVSYNGGTATVDAGNSAVASNAQLDLAADRVWAILILAKMQ